MGEAERQPGATARLSIHPAGRLPLTQPPGARTSSPGTRSTSERTRWEALKIPPSLRGTASFLIQVCLLCTASTSGCDETGLSLSRSEELAIVVELNSK